MDGSSMSYFVERSESFEFAFEFECMVELISHNKWIPS